MPPYPMWFQGRDAVVAALAASWDARSPGYVGRFQMVPTRANRHPAHGAATGAPMSFCAIVSRGLATRGRMSPSRAGTGGTLVAFGSGTGHHCVALENRRCHLEVGERLTKSGPLYGEATPTHAR
jgi:hypothetical protein